MLGFGGQRPPAPLALASEGPKAQPLEVARFYELRSDMQQGRDPPPLDMPRGFQNETNRIVPTSGMRMLPIRIYNGHHMRTIRTCRAPPVVAWGRRSGRAGRSWPVVAWERARGRVGAVERANRNGRPKAPALAASRVSARRAGRRGGRYSDSAMIRRSAVSMWPSSNMDKGQGMDTICHISIGSAR